MGVNGVRLLPPWALRGGDGDLREPSSLGLVDEHCLRHEQFRPCFHEVLGDCLGSVESSFAKITSDSCFPGTRALKELKPELCPEW